MIGTIYSSTADNLTPPARSRTGLISPQAKVQRPVGWLVIRLSVSRIKVQQNCRELLTSVTSAMSLSRHGLGELLWSRSLRCVYPVVLTIVALLFPHPGPAASSGRDAARVFPDYHHFRGSDSFSYWAAPTCSARTSTSWPQQSTSRSGKSCS